jgi:hypothetical protein
MNQTHPAKVKPSWYGDSVGHYEGDILVIDTVGVKVGPFASAGGGVVLHLQRRPLAGVLAGRVVPFGGGLVGIVAAPKFFGPQDGANMRRWAARAVRRALHVQRIAELIIAEQATGPRRRCYVCDKKLTDKDSIARGIGPECWQDVLDQIAIARAAAVSVSVSP